MRQDVSGSKIKVYYIKLMFPYNESENNRINVNETIEPKIEISINNFLI